MEKIKIPGNEFFTKHITGKLEDNVDFELIIGNEIRLGEKVFVFENQWNKARHFMGLMHAMDNNLRMTERLN